MKLLFFKIGLIILFLFSCKPETVIKPINEIYLEPGKIIGFNQCLKYESFVIVVNSDTLVTYDDLDSLYGAFPEYYYYNYQGDFMFPEDVRDKYPVYVNYSMVQEKDLKGVACSADIWTSAWVYTVRNRQIKINYITKYPLTKVTLE
jgi:hypothetical protein